MLSNLVTSPVTPMALPPSCSIAVTTLATAAWSRPCTATVAPRRANSPAMASPIPRELPVTRATWPCSVLMPRSFRRDGFWRRGLVGRRGCSDEAHVDDGELPVACVGDQGEGGADGIGNGVTLIGAAGVDAGGGDCRLAELAGLDLVEAESLEIG